MRKSVGLLIICASLLFSSSARANWNDFLQYFANPNWGVDPQQPDTVYLVCSQSGNSQQIVQIRLVTDNSGYADSVLGFYLPLIITTNQTGVVLDTTIATIFTGTDCQEWYQGVYLQYGDPSLFPMKMTVGAVGLGPHPASLSPGNHLLARLVFNVSEPTKICLDTTSHVSTGLPLLLTTRYPSVDYQPQWRPACCDQVVPTLSEWGLVVFSILLFTLVILYLRRRTKTA